jgi:hypothetical protein
VALDTDLPEKSSTQHLQPDKDFPQCRKNLMAPSNKGGKGGIVYVPLSYHF